MHLFSTNDDVATILFEPMIFEEEEEGREKKGANKAAGLMLLFFVFLGAVEGATMGAKDTSSAEVGACPGAFLGDGWCDPSCNTAAHKFE